MRRETGDAAYLWDMHDACVLVIGFCEGMTLDLYRANVLVRSAVERQIEIVGEAARGVSREFKTAHPEIAWRAIVAQRHVLAHEYGEVEDELIWRVASVRVPELLDILLPLLPARPDSGRDTSIHTPEPTPPPVSDEVD